MTSLELLEALGSVRAQYIEETRAIRAGEIPARPRLRANRLLLIAAVIALTALLVGCAVVYMLRMQDLKVGQYSFDTPTYYDRDGNVIPAATQEPLTQLSLQGTNMEALAEWVAFTNSYDPDLSIAQAADKAAREGSADSPWNFPANYHLTYGCYSREMMDKLDEIVEKYDLKLLSEYIDFNWWESRALLDSLSIDGLLYDDSEAQYWDGYLHLEGTFDLNILLTLDMGDWEYQEEFASYRYSLKEYFDPSTGFMQESHDYTQWDYTREDGKTVLLVLNTGTARIYADLPEAFISISLDPVIWVDGQEVPMTQGALERFAELFDLDVKPQPTTMETVEKYKAEAQAQYEADKAASKAEHEAQYAAGYEEYVQYCLTNFASPETASYVLWDVNGDGVEELVINCGDILSMKDGESYQYFSLSECGVFIARFRPCEGNVFEVWTEDFGAWQHYFYQAGPESATFLNGVIYDSTNDVWYQSLSGGSYTENRQQITKAEAQAILDSYTPIDFDWLPLKKFGKSVLSITCTDPYSRYIANILDRYDDVTGYTYALLDLTGDGQKELITRDVQVGRAGETYLMLNVHSIVDGQLTDPGGSSFAYICQGNILEYTTPYDDGRGYHEYYRITADGFQVIDRLLQERDTLVWARDADGDGPGGYEYITEAEAMSVIASYKRLDLDMKPITDYPLQ